MQVEHPELNPLKRARVESNASDSAAEKSGQSRIFLSQYFSGSSYCATFFKWPIQEFEFCELVSSISFVSFLHSFQIMTFLEILDLTRTASVSREWLDLLSSDVTDQHFWSTRFVADLGQHAYTSFLLSQRNPLNRSCGWGVKHHLLWRLVGLVSNGDFDHMRDLWVSDHTFIPHHHTTLLFVMFLQVCIALERKRLSSKRIPQVKN